VRTVAWVSCWAFLFSLVTVAAVVAGATGFAEQVLRLWVAPLLFVALPLHFAIELPEHVRCDADTTDVLRNTRPITGGRFSTWFTNGNNLNVEHHAAMTVPLQRLPERHKAVRECAKYVEQTYWSFYRSVLRELADPRRGGLVWISDGLPGSTHDLTAARIHGVLDAADRADVELLVDKGYQDAGGTTCGPYKGRKLTKAQKTHSRMVNSVRAPGERGFAVLKAWRIFRLENALPGLIPAICASVARGRANPVPAVHR
jgi:hypothetical protein